MVSSEPTPSSSIDRHPGHVAGLRTAIGMAYSGYALRVVSEHPQLSDYVEVPFEQFARDAGAISVQDEVPIVLHCASLSLAGSTPPTPEVIEQLGHWIGRTGTPWLGEHLAFIREGEYEVEFTVNPQFSPAVLDRVVAATEKWSRRLNCPILLENGPIYVQLPGSVMSQLEFLTGVCARLESAYLLVDLSHLLITCRNLALDPRAALEALPLDRVVEVHLSGLRKEGGVWWDDHGRPVPDEEFDLLARLLRAVQPRAITIEYNWDSQFPLDLLRRDFGRVRDLVASA